MSKFLITVFKKLLILKIFKVLVIFHSYPRMRFAVIARLRISRSREEDIIPRIQVSDVKSFGRILVRLAHTPVWAIGYQGGSIIEVTRYRLRSVTDPND